MKGTAGTKLKSGEISVKIIRSDGTVEDYGTVIMYHSNPLLNSIFQIRMELKRWHMSLRTKVKKLL